MNIVYMIGNGFDLNLDLKTSYKEFYNYYLTIPTENSLIQQFKKEINNDINSDFQKWSELEVSLGEYTQNLENIEELYAIYDDLISNLTSYLKI